MKDKDAGFVCSRRAAFRLPLQEARVMLGALRGKLPARLADLASLPDEQLAAIRPVLSQLFQVSVRDGWVCARLKQPPATEHGAPVEVCLFPMEQENLIAYNLWNGQHDLGETSQELASALDWPAERAFAHVRELFLSLAGRLVVVPKNPPAAEG
ncbi:MAG: hypothetical protein ACYC5O_07885 [Anaerolineae bacterium]